MAMILRIDVDHAYDNSVFDHLRIRQDMFMPSDKLGYLGTCRGVIKDLNERGIKTSIFFRPSTRPNKSFANDLIKRGHSIGLHAVNTKDHDSFSRELKRINKMFEDHVSGFTKHGSGKAKLSRTHNPKYEPNKFIEFAKSSKLRYYLGNGENPEERERSIDGILYFPTAFWLNRNYRESKYTVEWLVDEAMNRNIVFIIHPIEIKIGTQLILQEFENILDKVNDIKTIDSIIESGVLCG